MWRSLRIVVAIVVTAVGFYYVYLAFERQFNAFLDFRPHASTVVWALLSFGLIALSSLCEAGAWHGALRAFHIALPGRQAFAIAFTSQVSKYIPGNVGQHVGRVGLLRRFNYSLGDSIKATLLGGLSLPLGAAALFAVCAFSQVVVGYLITLFTRPGLLPLDWVEMLQPLYTWPNNIGLAFFIIVLCFGVQGLVYQFLRDRRMLFSRAISLLPTPSTAYVMFSYIGAFVTAHVSLYAAINAVAVDAVRLEFVWVSLVAFTATGVAGYVIISSSTTTLSNMWATMTACRASAGDTSGTEARWCPACRRSEQMDAGRTALQAVASQLVPA